MERIWLASYPAGVPENIDPDVYPHVAAMLEDSFRKYANRDAFAFMGRHTTYGQWDRDSRALGAYLQSLGLRPGDRVAVMMPNVPQYPVAVAAILRAGMAVVNVNPLYTPRELEHQLKDSGATAIILLENFAHTLQHVIAHTQVRHVLVANMGETLGFPMGALVNYVVRKKKKLVPSWSLPQHVGWTAALKAGAGMRLDAPRIGAEDVALLQYTGGTTGVAKGAMLTQRNIVANVAQSAAWYSPALRKVPAGEVVNTICALPLYHIFAFTVIMMLTAYEGGMMILIPNPRDLSATLKELKRYPIHSFPAVNTLFNALLHHPRFEEVNWHTLRLCVGGGMAVQEAVAQRWLERTGCPICEGYGLSETSPSAVCNPTDTDRYSGTIGLPIPSTDLKLVDDKGVEVPAGQPGEIALRGPQVMLGYWNRPEETAEAFTADGFLRTGDIAVMDDRGYVKIIDRKKDMILVSGFNVFPNEVEAVAVMHPGVLEAAAVGVPDEHSGEAVKLFVVRKDPELAEHQLRAFLHEQLTGYKRPKHIEFRDDLPKTTVGKILRRHLRPDA